jgi:hypothetical protein
MAGRVRNSMEHTLFDVEKLPIDEPWSHN